MPGARRLGIQPELDPHFETAESGIVALCVIINISGECAAKFAARVRVVEAN